MAKARRIKLDIQTINLHYEKPTTYQHVICFYGMQNH